MFLLWRCWACLFGEPARSFPRPPGKWDLPLSGPSSRDGPSSSVPAPPSNEPSRPGCAAVKGAPLRGSNAPRPSSHHNRARKAEFPAQFGNLRSRPPYWAGPGNHGPVMITRLPALVPEFPRLPTPAGPILPRGTLKLPEGLALNHPTGPWPRPLRRPFPTKGSPGGTRPSPPNPSSAVFSNKPRRKKGMAARMGGGKSPDWNDSASLRARHRGC